MSDILETCGNGVHGDWFPTDSLPLPDEFCWNNCETQLESESSQDDHSSYPVGERLGGTQPCGGCVMIQRKALVALVLEIWHLQEGPGRVCWVLQQVQAQSRVLVPVKVELMSTSWGQTPYWHVHEKCHQTVLHVSKNGISHSKSACWPAHKGFPEYPISWEVCFLPLIKKMICFLSLHTCQHSFRLGLYVSNTSVTRAAVT